MLFSGHTQRTPHAPLLCAVVSVMVSAVAVAERGFKLTCGADRTSMHRKRRETRQWDQTFKILLFAKVCDHVLKQTPDGWKQLFLTVVVACANQVATTSKNKKVMVTF